jgi:endonuclease/exonuclease/phosphatase family metal-dependent hydrolase
MPVDPVSATAERFTQTVSALRVIDRDRRRSLIQNPDGKSAAALNQQVPEITEIEVDNRLSNATADATDKNILHVAAWNLERGRCWRTAARLLQEHPVLQQIDILCLSEMDNGMVRTDNEHTTRELALALKMNYVYGVEFLELTAGTFEEQERFQGDNDRGYHGNAILSRLPLHNPRLLRFPGIEKWYGSLENRLGGRNALLADVQLGKQTVTIVSTHLESGSGDTESRTQQGQSILHEVSALDRDRPVIIAGDLNSAPTAAVIANFRQAGFLVDETNTLNHSTYQELIDGEIRPGTYHIDYILARGLQVVQKTTAPAVIMAAYPCKPTGEMLSDHAIVVADLQLPELD